MDTAESFKILNRFFVDMIRPNLLKIIIAIAVMIVSSACTAGMAYLIKPLLNNVVVPKSVDNLYYISFLIMGVTLVKTVTQYIYTVILSAVGLGVTSIARMNLFDKFVNQDMYFYTKNKPGELISMMMNDVNTMSNMSTEVPINIGRDMFTFIGLMGVMLFNNFYYSLIMVGSLFFIIYPIKFIFLYFCLCLFMYFCYYYI
jgi:subfamily B ATP-binding cassette protein MsbA